MNVFVQYYEQSQWRNRFDISCYPASILSRKISYIVSLCVYYDLHEPHTRARAHTHTPTHHYAPMAHAHIETWKRATHATHALGRAAA